MTDAMKNTKKITVVCTGNICRSPMGEVMLRHHLNQESIGDVKGIEVNSCGLGGWHEGEAADTRALKQLSTDGYDGFAHRAAKFNQQDHGDADLYLAMDSGHVKGLKELGVPEEKIRLFRSFDPNSPEGAVVADPYYGTEKDFATVAREVKAAIPGIIRACS